MRPIQKGGTGVTARINGGEIALKTFLDGQYPDRLRGKPFIRGGGGGKIARDILRERGGVLNVAMTCNATSGL